ncbi:MAG TPA: His/Gly/Thr/Pro-type tRNA ligase C-terminal domain-containing protein, partial [Thermoplasmata archaeon]|nr:His/Gly/Thr/Pro-type tRNA ligase C-terminal domain-containing protein [Thermoplasmata archaeon]
SGAADERVRSNLEAFSRMAAALALPYVPVRRPDWDKFPGAHYSVALDIPVGGGRTLQIGSIHHYRENFAKPYGIRYEDPSGEQRFVHQTTFGLSERLIGAILAVHGDRRGAVFPSEIAPYQIVIVPIPGGSANSAVEPFVEGLAGRLRSRGVRVWVDRGEERPGAKYYRWESAGVPLRLEIGPREAAAGTVTAANRIGTKQAIGPGNLEEGVVAALAGYDRDLFARADAEFRQSFAAAARLEDLPGSTAVRVLPWCGEETCGHAIETAIDGALLGTPEGTLPIPLGTPGPCAACGSTTSSVWALAGRPL